MGVSLKLVAVLICVVLTAVTASLILAVSLTFTQRAVDEIGLRYTRLTMTNLRNEITGLLQSAVEEYYGVSAQAMMRSWRLPNETYPASLGWTGNFSTTPVASAWTYVDDWQQLSSSVILATNFSREFMAQTCFADGAFMSTTVGSVNNVTRYYTHFQIGSAGAFRYYSYFTNQLQSVNAPTNRNGFDCRTRPYYVNSPRAPKACYWEAPYLTLVNSTVVGIFCGIHNNSLSFNGVNGMALSMSVMSKFVVNIERTANTQAFVVENTGYLLASTHPTPYETVYFFKAATFVPPYNGTYKSNCLLGSALNYIIICRESVESFPYAPLRDLNRTVGVQPPASGPVSGSLQSGGDNYWYGMTGIQTFTGESNTTAIPGLTWVVAVLVPELDVLSEVVAGRTFSIIAACAVFVVASVVCFVLFSVFMSPLTELEEQMGLAAGMELDEEDPEPSALSEIGNMQAAFATMKAELRRVKQYLPQTLLANREDDDDDDPKSPTGVLDTQTARSERSHATGRKSNRSSSVADSKAASSHSSGGGAARLNVDATIARRKVTVVALNLSNFHTGKAGGAQAAAAPAEFRPRQEAALAVFKRVISEQKGVVDSFHGDRFIATFNACLNNPQHALRATKAVDELKEHPSMGGAVTIGVASGVAFVGNMGIDGLKRFCTVGAVYSQATLLERLGKLHADKRPALFASSTQVEAAFEYYFQAIDVVRLPGASKPSVVYVPEGRRNAAANEWMYVLESGAQSDLFVRMNDAFEMYAKGDVEAARVEAGKVPQGALYGRARLQAIVAQSLETTVADKGIFFSALSNARGLGSPLSE